MFTRDTGRTLYYITYFFTYPFSTESRSVSKNQIYRNSPGKTPTVDGSYFIIRVLYEIKTKKFSFLQQKQRHTNSEQK